MLYSRTPITPYPKYKDTHVYQILFQVPLETPLLCGKGLVFGCLVLKSPLSSSFSGAYSPFLYFTDLSIFISVSFYCKPFSFFLLSLFLVYVTNILPAVE